MAMSMNYPAASRGVSKVKFISIDKRRVGRGAQRRNPPLRAMGSANAHPILLLMTRFFGANGPILARCNSAKRPPACGNGTFWKRRLQ